MTIKEAAKVLGVSRARVQQFVDGGRLPSVRLGATGGKTVIHLIRKDDLIKFAAIERRVGKPPRDQKCN